MSKHTERGIGQQGGPIGDGLSDDDAKPRRPSQMKVTPSSAAEDEPVDGKRGGRAEIGQITLLGVSAPVFNREKVTAPGRDVHLPTEVRRVALPRAVAPETAAAAPPRRQTPEQARAALEATPTIRIKGPYGSPSAAGQLTGDRDDHRGSGGDRGGAGATIRAALPSVGREHDKTTLMQVGIMPAPGLRGLIALGVGISVALAVVVIWAVRFGPTVRSGGGALAQPDVRANPRLDTRPPGPPAAASRLAPRPQTEMGAPLPSADAPNVGAPEAGNAAGGAPRSPTDEPSTTAGAAVPPAGALPTEAPDDLPSKSAGDPNAKYPGDIDRDENPVHRVPPRPRPAPSADWPPVPGSALPSNGAVKRGSSPGFGGRIDGSRAAPASPSAVSPPPFPPARPTGARTDEVRAPYDPDSPLPPAAD